MTNSNPVQVAPTIESPVPMFLGYFYPQNGAAGTLLAALREQDVILPVQKELWFARVKESLEIMLRIVTESPQSTAWSEASLHQARLNFNQLARECEMYHYQLPTPLLEPIVQVPEEEPIPLNTGSFWEELSDEMETETVVYNTPEGRLQVGEWLLAHYRATRRTHWQIVVSDELLDWQSIENYSRIWNEATEEELRTVECEDFTREEIEAVSCRDTLVKSLEIETYKCTLNALFTDPIFIDNFDRDGFLAELEPLRESMQTDAGWYTPADYAALAKIETFFSL